LKNSATFRQKTCLIIFLLPAEIENFGAEIEEENEESVDNTQISNDIKNSEEFNWEIHKNWTKRIFKKTIDDITTLVNEI
jgi:hypothetical protein